MMLVRVNGSGGGWLRLTATEADEEVDDDDVGRAHHCVVQDSLPPGGLWVRGRLRAPDEEERVKEVQPLRDEPQEGAPHEADGCVCMSGGGGGGGDCALDSPPIQV